MLAGLGMIAWGVNKLLSSAATVSNEVKWEFLVEEGKCTPLEQLHQIVPGVVGSANPEEVFRLVKDQFPDAQMRRLIDVVAEDHRKNGTKPSAKENDYYKSFQSDVFVLSVRARGGLPVRTRDEIVILTDVLCKRMSSLIQDRPE
jgi:replicative DNA helicase